MPSNFPDVRVAVVFCRRRKESAWPPNGLPPNFKDYGNIYEVLLVRAEDSAKKATDIKWTFPQIACVEDEDPAQTCSKAWDFLKPKRTELVDAVPISESGTLLLYFAPMSNAQSRTKSPDGSFADITKWDGARWASLATVLESLHPLGAPALVFTHNAHHLIASLDEWLSETHFNPRNVATMWSKANASRIVQVVRNSNATANNNTNQPNRNGNPALGHNANSNNHTSKQPKLRAHTVSNPLFNSGLVLFKQGTSFEDLPSSYRDEYEADAVKAIAGAKKLRESKYSPEPPLSRSNSPLGSPEPNFDLPPSWSSKFPLHSAAVIGDVERLRGLIRAGHAASKPDDDSWTPLHYAAWHGKTSVVRELMRDWQGGPIDTTDNGSTALHFAARNGFPDVVTILLACPIVKADAKDKDRQTPLMLCEKLQQGNWTEVSKILKNPKARDAVNRFAGLGDFDPDGDYFFQDFRIFLLDGSEKVIRLPDTITAKQLRDGMAGMLQIPEESYNLFSIWITSPSLTIQLENDMQPMDRIRRWPKMAELYTEPENWKDPALLIFKRNQLISLREERKTRSPVALKFLFDEALVNFLWSYWPCSVADSVFLAGLLMQIRYGDFDPAKHKPGFLSDGLETFVPSHLMHNQLRTAEWERQIYAAHKQHMGKTDLHLLHRLFLQYCWQWPFYGATFFEAELPKAKRNIVGAKNAPIRVGITTEWLTVIMVENNVQKAALSVDTLTNEFDTMSGTNVIIRCGDVNQVAGLQPYLRGGPGDVITVASKQALLIHMLLASIHKKLKKEEDMRGRQRIAQGGPNLQHISDAPQLESASDLEERRQFMERLEKERNTRYKLLMSFGEDLSSTQKCSAQTLFENRPSCVDGYVPIEELNQVFMELGYWLGPQLDAAREFLQSGGERKFNFMDVVSWWSQSARNWLFLLDDTAFKQRITATEIFLRNDPQRTGRVSGEKLMGVIRGLRSANLTKKSEQVCLKGVDPHDDGFVQFNDYVDWMCQMKIIYDREPL